MSGAGKTRVFKAKIIDDPIADPSLKRWKVRLNPDTLDLKHPGNTLWFLEFDKPAVVGPPTPPTKQTDLGRSTFELNADAEVKECRLTTVDEFFAMGTKYEPGGYRDDNRDNPNGTIGDPTSRSSLC